MTLYINPIRRGPRRAMRDEMMRDWDEDYSARVTFPMDVKEDANAFTIEALLPGIQPDDLDIQIVNEAVTISGEIKPDRDEDAKYLLSERPTGTFRRVITLPTPLDSSNVEAELDQGVLTLKIPKIEEAKPRTIKVNRK